MAAGIAMKTDEQIDERLDERCIATIRTLCIDAIQQADSGHPRARAHERSAAGREHVWQVLGASRGEAGILGDGVRQAQLRDPTYAPALEAARELSQPRVAR